MKLLIKMNSRRNCKSHNRSTIEYYKMCIFLIFGKFHLVRLFLCCSLKMFKSYFQRSLDQFYTIWYFLHTYYEEIWNAIYSVLVF